MIFKTLRYFSFTVFILSLGQTTLANVQSKTLEAVRKSVVSINGNIVVSQRFHASPHYAGTGSVLNRKKGLILTNAHVAKPWAKVIYEITFYNGVKVDAKLIYSDPVVDFAFLQVEKEDISKIPSSIPDIKMVEKGYKMHMPVFMVSNNAGQAQSVQTGFISSLYGRDNTFPFQSIMISLNAAGGSSGSPLFNSKGQAIGLVYGGGDGTRAIAMPIEYVTDALKKVLKNTLPKRKTLHTNFTLINASDAVRYMKAPEALIQSYVKKFPNSRNRLLVVRNFFPGIGGKFPLKRDDIILKVNGVEVGPSLLSLDRAIEKEGKETAQITLLRGVISNSKGEQCLPSGKEMQTMDLTVPLFEATDHAPVMLEYGGAVFCAPDDFTRLTSGDLGYNGKGVYCGNYFSPGFISAKIPKIDMAGIPIVWQLTSIGDIEIRTLKDLIDAVTKLHTKKYVTMGIVSPINYFPFGNLLVNQRFKGSLFLDLYEHNIARLYTWNQASLEWKTELITPGKV